MEQQDRASTKSTRVLQEGVGFLPFLRLLDLGSGFVDHASRLLEGSRILVRGLIFEPIVFASSGPSRFLVNSHI